MGLSKERSKSRKFHISLLYTDLEARVWYTSNDGENTDTCGQQKNAACKTLDYVIPSTQSGDSILLMPDQSGSTTHNNCASQPIRYNLTIAGTEPKIFLTCTKKTEFFKFVFIFENANVLIRNVGFKHGSLLALNSYIQIIDSTFVNGQIYLMDHKTINHYSQNNFTLKNLDQKMLNAAESNKSDQSLQCTSVRLGLHQVQWGYANDDVTDIYLDSLITDGIQVICHNINIEITDSILADKQIFVYAISHLDFRFIRSTFKGLEDGRNVQGGIKLNTFISPLILIEDSSISSLLFSNFFYAIFSAQQYMTAAVYIRVLQSQLPRLPTSFNECVIRNTMFSDNFRCLNFAPDPSIPYHCHVIGSNFTTNHVLTDGGAVVISGDEESLFALNFTQCYFDQNAAGGRELDFPEEKDFPIQIHREPGIVITSFEEIEEDSFQIYMQLFYNDDIEPVDEVVFLDISGSGGAIYAGTASVLVEDCLFMNNSASMYGGAIHIVKHGQLKVVDSVFYSPPEDQELEDGTIISSFGKSFILNNVELNQVSPYASEASVFFHEKDGYADTAAVVNISIICPVNARIHTHNVSLEIFKRENWDDTSPYLKYKELWYDCFSCNSDSYSLAGGLFKHLAYPMSNQSTSLFTQKIIYEQIECHDCSFGGHCADGNIYPKVQYWGIAKNGAVEFYNCPSSYCCTEPVCESGYDTCAPYRVGTLCGRCGTNYSEAMFSRICIHNDSCHATWMFPVTCALAFIYAMFLLFQSDLKDFLVGQPKAPAPGIGQLKNPKVMKVMAYHNDVQLDESETGEIENTHGLKTDKENVPPDKNSIVVELPRINDVTTGNEIVENNGKAQVMEDGTNSENNIEADVTKLDEAKQREQQLQNKQDEGGIFLILLFYYFQDSSIVYIRATYTNVENELMRTLKDIAGSLFKFRIDLSFFVSNVCILPDVTPVLKIVLKLIFQPALFSILIIIAIFAHCLKQCSDKKSTQKFGTTLSTKTASGMVFAILFSYQTVARSMFSLVHCVNVNGTKVLFVDGNIVCYESWQVFTLIAIAFCLIPFSLYLTLAPRTLLKGRINVVSFFTACFCAPIVSTFLYIVHKIQDGRTGRSPVSANRKVLSISPEARAVYKILQGPYREYSIKFCRVKIYLCWSGILLARRLMLTLCDTFIHDLLLRVSTYN